MSLAGLKIINDNGSVQVNTEYCNLCLISKQPLSRYKTGTITADIYNATMPPYNVNSGYSTLKKDRYVIPINTSETIYGITRIMSVLKQAIFFRNANNNIILYFPENTDVSKLDVYIYGEDIPTYCSAGMRVYDENKRLIYNTQESFLNELIVNQGLHSVMEWGDLHDYALMLVPLFSSEIIRDGRYEVTRPTFIRDKNNGFFCYATYQPEGMVSSSFIWNIYTFIYIKIRQEV